MGYLKYKMFWGTVDYDEDAKCLWGRVLGLSRKESHMSYRGHSLEELEHNFQQIVDNYIFECNIKGEDPKRPFNGPLNVRLGPDLHARAAFMAQEMNMNMNFLIKQAVETYLDMTEQRRKGT